MAHWTNLSPSASAARVVSCLMPLLAIHSIFSKESPDLGFSEKFKYASLAQRAEARSSARGEMKIPR